jgi:vitamin B12 transporter
MRRPWPRLISMVLLFLPFSLFSEDGPQQKSPPPAEHHEIVVTATRLETPAREVGSSVSVISGESLERFKREFILEALRESVGVSITQNGGPGEAASVFLRGANSEHTLVLLDGVALNDPINPSRSADLAHIYADNIDRVEILRGPQSPLYGSDALAGIVNIITKRGRGPARWTLGTSGGSFGTFSGQAGVSGSTDRVDYSLGLTGFTSRGISAASTLRPGNSEKDGYRNLSLSGRIGVRLRKNIELEFIGRSVAARTDIDNFGGAYGDDPNNRQDYRSVFLKTQVRGLFLQNRWEQRLAVSLVDSRRTHDNPADILHPLESENGVFKGRLLTVDWQNNLFVHSSHTVTAGLEVRQEQGESEYHYYSFGQDFPSLFPLQNATTVGLYVQDSIRLADRFFAAAGIRYDHHSRSGDALTYRLAPAYIIRATRTKVRASLATGFKAPSIYQLYAPGTIYGPIGNRSLRPEKVLGWDAGIEQSWLDDRVRASLTYFRNDFENLIDFSFAQGYINIGRALSRGVEAEVEARPLGDLSLSLLLTHLDARDTVTGQRLLRRPRNTASAVVRYDFLGRWSASLSYDYAGVRRDVDYSAYASVPVSLAPYSLLNGVITFLAAPNLQLFARVDNALNAKYEMVFGYGTPGASLQLGARLSL